MAVHCCGRTRERGAHGATASKRILVAPTSDCRQSLEALPCRNQRGIILLPDRREIQGPQRTPAYILTAGSVLYLWGFMTGERAADGRGPAEQAHAHAEQAPPRAALGLDRRPQRDGTLTRPLSERTFQG